MGLFLRPQGTTGASAPSPRTALNLSTEFRVLFDRDYPYVWHSVRRLGVREADCDDVANEIFVRVHKQFDQYDPTRASRPWLFAFCARVASDYRRLARHKRESTFESDATIVATTSDPEQDALRREAGSVVLAALDVLDDDRRQVFVLHEMDELPIPEVARVLQIPVGTAYTRLRAARQEFTAAARRLQQGGMR